MKNDNVDPRLFDLLDELKSTTPRDSHAASRGRARFLTEAVSLREKQRHTGWILFPFKEKLTMNILVSALVIVGLLFGGSATVSAAQDDLPNQPLYQIKLMSENAQLWLVSDPAQQIDMLMEQAQTRLQEMQMLAEEGIIPPAAISVHAQERIQQAMQIAAQLDQESQLAALQQIRIRLQTHEQQMLYLEQGACIECVPVLEQTHEMLRLQLKDVENRLADPSTMQNQNQTQTQNQLRTNQTQQAIGTAIPPYGTCTPALDGTGQQSGNGSQSVSTPAQQQNQTQQQNQSGGGSPTGSGSGSSTGSGGQNGKP